MEVLPGQPETVISPDPRPQAGPLARLRYRLYVILEAGKTGDAASRLFDVFMVTLILANVAAFAAETEPALAAQYGDAFALFDTISILIFTAEYVLRLWVCADHPPLKEYGPVQVRVRWALTVPMLIDLAVILPFYLSLLFPIDLRVLRVFRLVRFFKLARFSPALYSMGRVFYAERRAVMAATIVMMGLLILSSSMIYALEHEVQPDEFGSVPKAMWWALATLTTVGYGDVVPVTALGKIFGGLVMIFGLGMFALPIAILSTGFSQEIHRRDFVVSWGMVARVPLFQGLRPGVLADLVDLLEAQVVEANTIIAHKDDFADAMYFIAVGKVRLCFDDRDVELDEGDFFGEMALLEARRRSATILTLSQCHLLKLNAGDFQRLIAHHPDARERLLEAVQTRGLKRGATDELEKEVVEEKKESGEPCDA